jgi:hypothetical protein
MAEDCYFFIDSSIPYEERKIDVYCIKCKEKKLPDNGWFWEGSKLGYGPFEFKCCCCEHIIYSGEKNENKIN